MEFTKCFIAPTKLFVTAGVSPVIVYGMARSATGRPTDAELEILGVLWANGPSTVRQVHQALLKSRDGHYNSVLKTLQIMLEKGLVTRDDAGYPQVYAPAASREKTERHLIKDLMDRVFQGSAASLLLRALSTQRPSREELAQLRKKIRDLEKGTEKGTGSD